MAGEAQTYLGGDGVESSLANADDTRRALSDLSRRVASVETAPSDGNASGGAGARLRRLEYVLNQYLGRELADYDREHGDIKQSAS